MAQRRLFLGLTAAAALGLPAFSLRAQAWPSRPVRVVVPFPPGGTTDFIARLVSTRLGAVFGQNFVIENRAGAGGTVGSDPVAKSPADGYSLVVSNVAAHGVGPSVYKTMPYDSVRDFSHIALMAEIPSVLVVRVDSPIRTLAEFIAAAKARPGQMTVGSPGNGTSSHTKQELLKRSAGIDTVHVPYRGSGPMMTDLAGGQVDAIITTLVEAGRNPRYRLLAVTAGDRVPGWLDLPTFRELGHPDLVASTWFGLSGPAGMPSALVDKLNAELQEVVADKEVQAKLSQLGFEVWPSKTPDEFATYVADQLAHWSTMIRQANIRPEAQ